MTGPGLVKGDEAYVSVRINRHMSVDLLVTAISDQEVGVEVWGGEDADLFAVYEALKAAAGAVRHQLEKPRLKQLLEERIAQLKKQSEEAGWEDPPTPLTDDIPF